MRTTQRLYDVDEDEKGRKEARTAEGHLLRLREEAEEEAEDDWLRNHADALKCHERHDTDVLPEECARQRRPEVWFRSKKRLLLFILPGSTSGNAFIETR